METKLCTPGNLTNSSTSPCVINDTDIDYSYDWDNYEARFVNNLRNFVFPVTHEWVLISAYFLVFILALGGNVLVCYAVLRNPQMRTVTNYYILNLSIADILVSLICLPITVVFETSETWFFGNLACKLIPYFQVVSMSVSVLTLCAIAVDRYFAICHPLMFKSTAKRAITVIFSIWITSFLVPIPQAVVYETERPIYTKNYIYLTKCFERNWFGSIQQKVYHIALVLVIYVIPLVMIIIAYVFICRQLWAKIPGSYESCDSKKNASNGNSHVSTKASESQLKSRRKVAKMLIIVVVIFTICYLPLHLLNILRQFSFFDDVVHNTRSSFHIPFLIAHWLAFANSGVNPIIYNFLSAKFRREFKAAFACCFCCRDTKHKRGKRGHGYHSSMMNSSSVNNSKSYCNTEQMNMSVIRNSNANSNYYV
ncbi:orexin receptor-like protein [Saccoglossus kowalevskii]|uniref:Orexin receptor-like protein n=1 Tax=Saccoglossus kowalevskii TaxID=10224 RepID=D1LXA4_SACKO|nr:orexin receptor-like protein [Saccoglossus kowalevskii]ACY92610.1 orexin receptor-like protein [Saccoglossus kowalevskii]